MPGANTLAYSAYLSEGDFRYLKGELLGFPSNIGRIIKAHQGQKHSGLSYLLFSESGTDY